MLAEFLDRLVGLAKSAHKVDVHNIPQLPRTVFIRVGDVLHEHDVPPPWRQHDLAGLGDLVAALTDKGIAPRPEVYVSPREVVALLDRDDRRERITVRLEETKRWQLIAALQTPRAMQPKEAVKLLRLELHGGNVEHMIQALSRIDFVRTSSGRTNVEHGRETLGRSVEAAVQQANDVPKDFQLAVPVWSTSGFSRFSVNVQFGVYLDLEGQAVELRVLADEVERARNQALAAVVDELRAQLDGVQVFLGSPGLVGRA